MLSPHEFSTLILVKAAPDQTDLRRDELNVLLEQRLIVLEPAASGRQRFQLTPDGDSMLQSMLCPR